MKNEPTAILSKKLYLPLLDVRERMRAARSKREVHSKEGWGQMRAVRNGERARQAGKRKKNYTSADPKQESRNRQPPKPVR